MEFQGNNTPNSSIDHKYRPSSMDISGLSSSPDFCSANIEAYIDIQSSSFHMLRLPSLEAGSREATTHFSLVGGSGRKGVHIFIAMQQHNKKKGFDKIYVEVA